MIEPAGPSAKPPRTAHRATIGDLTVTVTQAAVRTDPPRWRATLTTPDGRIWRTLHIAATDWRPALTHTLARLIPQDRTP